jgi:hypothetical protein
MKYTVEDIIAVWQKAAKYFQSIEVALVLLMAFVMVGGVWLTAMADGRGLLLLAAVAAYFIARPILHVKGILSWPFL